MKRRMPWWVLAGLFVAVPLAEIYLLVQLGQVIGPWWTILVLLADGAFGAWLVKREGARAWRALSETLSSGRMPSQELADGALVLVGGTLLVTPGFITDVVGLLCILPFTRPLARRVLTRLVARRLTVRVAGTRTGPPSADADPRTRRRPGDHEVVRGDVVD